MDQYMWSAMLIAAGAGILWWKWHTSATKRTIDQNVRDPILRLYLTDDEGIRRVTRTIDSSDCCIECGYNGPQLEYRLGKFEDRLNKLIDKIMLAIAFLVIIFFGYLWASETLLAMIHHYFPSLF